MTPRHDLAPAATGWRGRIRSGAIVLGCLAGVLLSGGSVAAADRIAAEVRDEVVRRVESEEIVGVVVGVVDAEGASYFGYGRLSAGGERHLDADGMIEYYRQLLARTQATSLHPKEIRQYGPSCERKHGA